ncbi:sister chromatid cohesion C-terminus-domain-containing protein [Lophiotrema nucula]|uniref:Sister chromatid cohesion protein n=1 Tax=Lophiotrema nucula TaxID=690887 RepID=A0A6A5ZT64_9PLEO|nr:sister chromatid cohesion C-terminus-domain-containing protein [Lophiotrema nucula]
MASANGNWHNANGNGLPIRPPTVDEALPYSPFTSIVPFSPDIIPYPSAEPPIPPTTLTAEQQETAKKTVGTLNAEIKALPVQSQHLQRVLPELQKLLNPDDLTYFEFKSTTQLPTPPPDSPHIVSAPNGSAPSYTPSLSPFATMLLQNTEIFYKEPGMASPQKRHQRQPVPQPSSQSRSHPQVVVANSVASARNSGSSFPSTAPSSTSTPARPGPAVVIKPQTSVPREQYRRYDDITFDNESSRKRDSARAVDEGPKLTTQQREIADRQIHKLKDLVDQFVEAKDDMDDFNNTYDTITSEGVDFSTLKSERVEQLRGAVLNVLNIGSFHLVPASLILRIQSLCEPSIAVTSQLSIDPVGISEKEDDPRWLEDMATTEAGLTATRIVLETMTAGSDDRRTCSEDLIAILVKALKHVLDSCIFPIVKSRDNQSDSQQLFEKARKNKKQLLDVLRLCTRVFKLLGELLSKVTVAEIVLSPIETVAKDSLFVQNSDSETHAALGIQQVETLRQRACDVLVQIFAGYAGERQRNDFVDLILAEVGTLSDKASARQFKSTHENNIMLISALFMRFVHAAASKSSHGLGSPEEDELDEEDDAEEDDYSEDDSRRRVSKAPRRRHKVLGGRAHNADELFVNARETARRLASYLITEALKPKSNDKQFKSLMDMIIQDFCSYLGSPEWPAADLLLQTLLGMMMGVLRDQKRPVNDKHLALNAMSIMAVGILDFTYRAKQHQRALDISQSELSNKLVRLAEDAINDSIDGTDLLSFDGPYRNIIESLPSYLGTALEDSHTRSVLSCHITFWSRDLKTACQSDAITASGFQPPPTLERNLTKMVADPEWIFREYVPQKVSDSQSQLAAGIITLQGRFCRSLPNLVTLLINNTSNSSAKLQARAMSGLTAMVDKDARVLTEHQIISLSRKLENESSAQVRSYTLGLIATCLANDPSMERHCLDTILRRLGDPSTDPRKRAIKLLRDIYISKISKDKRLNIARSLLGLVRDPENTIVELVRQTLEDMWFSAPTAAKTDESHLKLDRSKRASMLVDVVHAIEKNPASLENIETFFTDALAEKAKNSTANSRTCKELVADLLDSVIGGDDKSQAHVLQTLSILAKVEPNLFTSNQVQLLKTYIKDLKTADELAIFRFTVRIFRYVLPVLPAVQVTFAEDIFTILKEGSSKLANWAAANILTCKETLVDVAHCLQTISPLILGEENQPPPRSQSGVQRVLLMVAGTLVQLAVTAAKPPVADVAEANSPAIRRFVTFLLLLGTFGKVWKLDKHAATFQPILRAQSRRSNLPPSPALRHLQDWNGRSVPVLFIENVLPLTMQAWHPRIRKQALSCLGEICHSSPGGFLRDDVAQAFRSALNRQSDEETKFIVLQQFRDFFATTERRSETGADIAVGEGAARGEERLIGSFKANDNDGAPLHLAQSYLSQIVQIALAQPNALAALATETIISVSRQGLVHPKKCGPPLVVLTTSPNTHIASIAHAEFHSMHLKNESILEKEYVTAVHQAYIYQRDVYNDPRGMIEETYRPKLGLFFTSLREGKRQTLKKFISNLCKRINFDLATLDSSRELPDAVLFARFCLENLGLFDLNRVDDIVHLTSELERIVLKGTGPTVALAIENELAKEISQPSLAPMLDDASIEPLVPLPIQQDAAIQNSIKEAMTEERLRQLATASIIIQMMWEARTFLKRAWNLQKTVTKADLPKPSTRLAFVTGRELYDSLSTLINGALDTPESMRKACNDCAELVNVDKEAAINDENADGEDALAQAAAAGYETPDENGEPSSASVPTSGKGRKRKSSVGLVGHTPKKSRGRPKGSTNKSRKSRTPESDEE